MRIQIHSYLIAAIRVAVGCTETLCDLAAEVTGLVIPKLPNLVGSENSLHSKELISHPNKISFFQCYSVVDHATI